jgi:hypothetical protein
MGPKLWFFLSVAAASTGFALLLALLLNGDILTNPGGVFVGALLLAAGATLFWMRIRAVKASMLGTSADD